MTGTSGPAPLPPQVRNQGPDPERRTVPRVVGDAVLALAVMLLGHQELTAGLDVEFSTGESFPGRSVALVVIPLGVSAGLTRSRPAVALVAAWIALLVQFLTWYRCSPPR